MGILREYITKRTLTHRVNECLSELESDRYNVMHILFDTTERSVIITLIHNILENSYSVWLAFKHGMTYERQRMYFFKFGCEIVETLYKDNPMIFKN